jgi:hypothetical protein
MVSANQIRNDVSKPCIHSDGAPRGWAFAIAQLDRGRPRADMRPLTADVAAIETVGGARQSYRRSSDEHAQVLPSELDE